MASFIDWEAEEGEEGEEGYGEDEDGEEGYDSEDLAFIDDDEPRARSSSSSVAFARLTNARHEQDEAGEARLIARFEQAGRQPAPRAMGMARPGVPSRPAMPPGKRPVEPPVRGRAAAMLSVFGSTLDDVESRQPPSPSAGGRGGRSSTPADVDSRANGRGGQPSAWQLRQPKKQSGFKYAPPAPVGSGRGGRGGLGRGGRGGRGDSDGRGGRGRGGPATTVVRPVAPRSAAAPPLPPSGASTTPRALAAALVLARRSSAGGAGGAAGGTGGAAGSVGGGAGGAGSAGGAAPAGGSGYKIKKKPGSVPKPAGPKPAGPKLAGPKLAGSVASTAPVPLSRKRSRDPDVPSGGPNPDRAKAKPGGKEGKSPRAGAQPAPKRAPKTAPVVTLVPVSSLLSTGGARAGREAAFRTDAAARRILDEQAVAERQRRQAEREASSANAVARSKESLRAAMLALADD